MSLVLCLMPDDPWGQRGCYGDTKKALPRRMRYLHPTAYAELVKMEAERPQCLFFSDVLRTAESSLLARRQGRGAQRPAYSGHNYGVSVDVDLDQTTKAMGTVFGKLVDWMASHGWYCHRRDRQVGHEAWHFNYLGTADPGQYLKDVKDTKPGTWHLAIEARIWSMYARQLDLDPRGSQGALQKLGLYHGDLDGIIGPLSREAVRCFQRTWDITETGDLDRHTERTLAFVTMEKLILPAP